MENFNEIIEKIINNDEFIKRKAYEHHMNESVYDHSLKVAYYSYKITKKLHLDYKKATIGALLHDFYEEPWLKNGKLNSKKQPLFKKHGFVHAANGAKNAKIYFPELVDEKVENIIKRHMFPLNITPPKYIEGWIVVLTDKYVSLSIFKKIKYLPKYIGIERKNKDE
ncbi:MAG: HD domain-containing protein [Bacilli bacterium]|nr:HD domain-containing protein [Bacilli bacterium]